MHCGLPLVIHQNIGTNKYSTHSYAKHDRQGQFKLVQAQRDGLKISRPAKVRPGQASKSAAGPPASVIISLSFGKCLSCLSSKINRLRCFTASYFIVILFTGLMSMEVYYMK
jgi:hypothetical protein